MTRQTYRALMAVIRALTDNPKDIDELEAYGKMPMRIAEATLKHAKEHAE